METNHEKFMRLLEQNKLKNECKEIIERYKVELNYPVKESMFYDIKKSRKILEEVYTKNGLIK